MSKKSFLCLFLSLAFLQASYGQGTKSIIASVQYNLTFTKNKQVLIDDICQLDITKNQSYFYGKGRLENLRRLNERAAKAEIIGTSINLGHLDSKDMIQNVCKFEILKDYAGKKAIYIQYIGQQYLGFIKDALRTSRWKILKETSKINGLYCRKAIMKKDTTLITAWFCTDIPFQDGPYYYYGLPGLIIKASSSSGFETSLISITYNKDSKKEIDVEPYALVSESQMIRAIGNQSAAFKSGKLPNGDEVKQVSGGH
jgi:GLPGLI family protein